MDVKIGVTHSPRELVVDSNESPETVQQKVTKALEDDSAVLSLTDRRGRQVLIPARRIAYVEIAEGDVRRVGFSIGD